MRKRVEENSGHCCSLSGSQNKKGEKKRGEKKRFCLKGWEKCTVATAKGWTHTQEQAETNKTTRWTLPAVEEGRGQASPQGLAVKGKGHLKRDHYRYVRIFTFFIHHPLFFVSPNFYPGSGPHPPLLSFNGETDSLLFLLSVKTSIVKSPPSILMKG